MSLKDNATPDTVVRDHRQPGPPLSVAYRGASTGNHDADFLAGLCVDGGSE